MVEEGRHFLAMEGREVFRHAVVRMPETVNALLSRHNFILLGLRGQAKTRLLRALHTLLDEAVPVVPDCEINDDPLAPLCSACRAQITAQGDKMPIGWLPRDRRYVEKLATPDVTIADMVGDIDPIKAARARLQLSDELTMHFGLLPRANRGIFAINELPDLAGKIQVGLFNILQEGDVQIKGYPIRLQLDVMLVFTANPEDYTARGKIITPLKDRIGSEIRTHYPATRDNAVAKSCRTTGSSSTRRIVSCAIFRCAAATPVCTRILTWGRGRGADHGQLLSSVRAPARPASTLAPTTSRQAIPRGRLSGSARRGTRALRR